MLTKSQIDAKFAAKETLTPAHSAAEGAVDADDEERLRQRVQHEAEPYPIEVPEVDCADLGKRYREAFDTPDGYPPMRMMNAEQFRNGPATAGHAANSPGYGPPGRPVPVPAAAMAPARISRPPLTDGHARPGVPQEAC